MSKQRMINLDNPLLDKLIEVYNNNEAEDKLAVVNLSNKELRMLILAVKNELAKEAILDYELFERRKEKAEFLRSKSN